MMRAPVSLPARRAMFRKIVGEAAGMPQNSDQLPFVVGDRKLAERSRAAADEDD